MVELPFQFFRCGFAVGFIRRIEFSAKRGSGAFIEGEADIFGTRLMQELIHEVNKAMDGVDRFVVTINYIVGYRKPAAEYVDAGVYQVDVCRHFKKV